MFESICIKKVNPDVGQEPTPSMENSASIETAAPRETESTPAELQAPESTLEQETGEDEVLAEPQNKELPEDQAETEIVNDNLNVNS